MTASAENQPEFEEPLDLSRFPPGEAKNITAFSNLLSKLDPRELEDYLKVMKILPTGVFDEMHFYGPSRYALIAYGKPGIDVLYRLSLESPIEAGHETGRALLYLATGDFEAAQHSVWLTHRYIDRDAYYRLILSIKNVCANPELQMEAKRALARVFRHYAADPRNRRGLGIVLGGLTLLRTEDSPSNRLISEIMSTATLSISDELCNEAEDLIRQNLLEKSYQDFFEKNPSLLDPLASSVVPRQALADLWKTDFVIRRFDEQYLFVELEKPRDVLFTDYPQPSSALAHALGQVLSWFAWVDDNLDYAQKHGFPQIHKPRGLIVIGRDASLSADQRRMLRTMNDLVDHRVQICTFDEVIRTARNVVRNLTSQ